MNRKVLATLWGVVIVIVGAMLLYYVKFTLSNSISYSNSDGIVLDLRDALFGEGQVVVINGNADFYGDTLLCPGDFDNPLLKPTGKLSVNDNWLGLRHDKPWPQGHGYGTYRFKLLMPSAGLYGLKIKDVKSAYKLFINGQHLGGSGHVANNAKEMVPSRYQMEYYFNVERKTIEVVIQVSNFHHQKGGLTGSIVIGKPLEIAYRKSKYAGIELFIIGSLFILVIYHLTLYAYRHKDKSTLYFSMLCLAMFFRLGYTGERIFLELFPFLGWLIPLKLEYISLYGLPIFTALFLNELFPDEISKKLVKPFVWFCSLIVGVILVLPPTLFSYIPIYSYIPIGIMCLYMLIKIGVAIKNDRECAQPVFMGFLVFFLLAIHDALLHVNAIQSLFLMPMGLFIVTFSQAYVLGQKTASAYRRSENLSLQLKDHALNLEGKVKRRTKKINKQKKELEKQKHQTEVKAQQLEASNQQLIKLGQFKKDMTNMMIHDLKAPLNSIMGFAELNMMDNEYGKYVLSSGWEMENLIQNILDVDKYELAEIQLNKENIGFHELVEDAFRSIYFLVALSKTTMHNKLPIDLFIKGDKNTINRVFVNIFSNAVKHAGDDIFIEVSSEIKVINEKDYCRINIFNSGKQIPENVIDTIFDKYRSTKEYSGSANYSSGIGLAFCRLAIESHGGFIGVESKKESGVTFYFDLPL